VSDAVWIALIAAGASVLGTLMTSLALVKVQQVLTATRATHDAVNGVMHEFTAAKVGQAHAEGVTAGEQAQRDRQNPEPQA
jgi:hypothetical protein